MAVNEVAPGGSDGPAAVHAAFHDWEQRYRSAVSLLAVSSPHVHHLDIKARVDTFLLDQYNLEVTHHRLAEQQAAASERAD